jgi:hypothetical protein
MLGVMSVLDGCAKLLGGLEDASAEPSPTRGTDLRQIDDPSAARGAAGSAENAVCDPDLKTVIERWHSLPEAVRAGILAMVQVTKVP